MISDEIKYNEQMKTFKYNGTAGDVYTRVTYAKEALPQNMVIYEFVEEGCTFINVYILNTLIAHMTFKVYPNKLIT